MNIYHSTEYFDNRIASPSTQTILQMEKNMPDVFNIFCEYQEALVTPLLKRDGVIADETYNELLNVAAQLTLATAVASAHDQSGLEEETGD